MSAAARGHVVDAQYVRDVWLVFFGTSKNVHGEDIAVYSMSMRAAFGEVAERVAVAVRTRST